jgi:hypothetical protein
MNSSAIAPHLIRFIGLVAVQQLLLGPMGQSVGSYFNILLYPLFILLLPLGSSTMLLILMGFLVGIAVDAPLSWGVHASAGVFSGAVRSGVLRLFAPKGGFSSKDPIFAPEYVGWQVFLQGAGLFFFVHIFWYFSVSYFAPVFALDITFKTLAAWPLSMVAVVLFMAMFNPKK